MVERLGMVLHWFAFLFALAVAAFAGSHIVLALGPDQCIANGWDYAWLEGGLCAKLLDRALPYLAVAIAAIAVGVGQRYVLTGRVAWFPWG